MKILTAATSAAKDLAGHASAPRVLVEIDFPAPVGTVRLAEEDITFNGNAYAGLIASVGAFRQTSLRGLDSLVIEVNNLGTPQFSAYFASAAPEKAPVRIYQHFKTITPDAVANLVLLLEGVIDVADIQWSQDRAVLPCVDATVAMPDVVGTVVDATVLPAAAERAYGKILPIVYGSMDRVPAIPASVLAVTKLYGSVPASSTSAINVEDTGDFTATGQIDIDEERITYTGKTATTFTGIARGASSTVAADHPHGADVRQVGTETYIVAGHAVKALTTAGIKVGPKLQTPVNLTSVSASDAASFPAIGTLATATFDGKPTYKDVKPTPEMQDVAMTAAGADNSATNPTYACGEHADYDETNYATVLPATAAAGGVLHVKRVGAVSEAGDILRPYVVIRYFMQSPNNRPSVSAKSPAVGWTVLGSGSTGLDRPIGVDSYPEVYGADASRDNINHEHAVAGGTVLTARMTRVVFNRYGQSGWTNAPAAYDGSDGSAATAGFGHDGSGRGAEIQYDRNVAAPEEGTGTVLKAIRVRARVRMAGGDGNSRFYVQLVADATVGGSKASGYVNPGETRDFETDWKYTSAWAAVRSIGTNAFFRASHGGFSATGTANIMETWIEYMLAPQVSPLTGTALRKGSNVFEQWFDASAVVGTNWANLNGIEVKVVQVDLYSADDRRDVYIYEIKVVVEHFPYTLVETDQVYADMDGWADDGAGHVTGTPSALLDRPAHIWHHFNEQYGLVAHADIDATTLAATHASLNAVPYVWALALVGEPPSFDEVLKQMARECRCWTLFEAGLARLLYMATPAPAAVKSLGTEEIMDGITVERISLPDEHANLVTLQYQVDWSASDRASGADGEDRYLAQLTDQNAASQATYGTYPRTVPCDFIRDATTATNLLAYLLAVWGVMRRLAKFRTFLNQLELERGDVVTLTYPLVGLAAPGTNVRLEAVRRTVGIGTQGQADTLEFEAREA